MTAAMIDGNRMPFLGDIPPSIVPPVCVDISLWSIPPDGVDVMLCCVTPDGEDVVLWSVTPDDVVILLWSVTPDGVASTGGGAVDVPDVPETLRLTLVYGSTRFLLTIIGHTPDVNKVKETLCAYV